MGQRVAQDAVIVDVKSPGNVRVAQDAVIVDVKSPGKVRIAQDALFVCVPTNSSGALGQGQVAQEALFVSQRHAGNVRVAHEAVFVSQKKLSTVRVAHVALFICIPTTPLSITYPLTLPSSPGPRTFKLAGNNNVAVSTSPYTAQQQVMQWPGEWWELEVGLPPMARATAEQWVSLLLALRGRLGTFLIGDHMNKTPRGVATGTPLVNGTNLNGSATLATKGWTASVTGIMLRGDYLQVGSGTTQRLHKIVTDANSDSSGHATFDIFPTIRESLSDGTALTISNTAGCFRLVDNRREWDVDYTKHYGIDFKAIEAI